MFACVLLKLLLKQIHKQKLSKSNSIIKVWLIVVGFPTICFTLRHTHGWQ